MEQTADKTLEEIMENYKYDIKSKNLSKEHYYLYNTCQFSIRSVIFDIKIIIVKLGDYHGKVQGNDVEVVKEKLKEYCSKCYEMIEEVEKERIKTKAILEGLYNDYKRFNYIKNVEETYRQCSKTCIDKSIELFVKFEKQMVLIKDEINIIIKLFHININF
jgi:hypothetical protein